MKRTLQITATAFMLFTAQEIMAQSPELDAWMLNTTGEKGQYDVGSGTVNMNDSVDILDVCYDNDDMYVRCNSLANYIMGPFPSNPNTPAAQNLTFVITRNPTEETGQKTPIPSVGQAGLCVNGVVLFGYGDGRSYSTANNANQANGDGLWNADAWVSEGSTMDANGNGHPNATGVYHYHANPITLYSDPSSIHSPIVGYSLDGFPIYGPFGYQNPNNENSPIVRIKSSYQLRSITVRDTLPDGSPSVPPGPNVNNQFPIGTYIEDYEYLANAGDLDEYNGRFCKTPEYPTGIYAYFITTKSNSDPAFPYIFASEYYGDVDISRVGPISGSATIPNGVNCKQGQDTSSSVNETKQIETLAVYPNPSFGQITITENTIGNKNLIISNIMGETVFRDNFITNKQTYSLEELTTGIYFITVTTKGGKHTVKLLKQ